MEEPMMFFKEHPVLLTTPEGKEAVKRYNRIGRALVQYELAYYDAWTIQEVRAIMKIFSQLLITLPLYYRLPL